MKRDELLKAVEAVIPGVDLPNRMGFDFLLFDGDWVRSFNDAVSVSYPLATGIHCAVQAQELAKILKKMTGEMVRISIETDGRLLIKDAYTTIKLSPMEDTLSTTMSKQVSTLHTDDLPWQPIPSNMQDGLAFCLPSAAKDPKLTLFACVAVKESMMYSTDNVRISEYTITKPGMGTTFLLPTNSTQNLMNLGKTYSKIAITESWAHFSDDSGLIISVRLLAAEYPFDKMEKVLAESFKFDKDCLYTFPDGLAKSIDRAEVLASTGTESLAAFTLIDLYRKGDALIVHGQKGGNEVEDKLKWPKATMPEDIVITTAPTFLKRILAVTNEFYIAKNKRAILFKGPGFRHFVLAKIV